MKNKILIIILTIISLLCISLGLYGYKLSSDKKDNENYKKNEVITNKIIYNYYLEDEKVDKIPTNEKIISEDGEETIDIKYSFSKSTCTNNIEGNFDTSKWEFVVTSGTNGTCDIYFVKTKYDVTLSIINGLEDENNLKEIDRSNDGEFKIIPNEGYKYKESLCSNNKNGEWNASTNTFKLTSIMSDVTCTVKFEKRKLNIEIVVNSKTGTGNTTEYAEYGDSKSIIVTPLTGYDNPTITCTNDQVATYENNSLNFEKITNDTKCSVTFKKIQVKKYSLNISNPTEYEDISITEGSESMTNLIEGSDISITLQTTDENTTPSLNCKDSNNQPILVTDTTGEDVTNTIRKFTIYGIADNITCKIEKK